MIDAHITIDNNSWLHIDWFDTFEGRINDYNDIQTTSDAGSTDKEQSRLLARNEYYPMDA